MALGAWAAPAQMKNAQNAGKQASARILAPEELDHLFMGAHKDFLANRTEQAAAMLRSAARRLEIEAKRAKASPENRFDEISKELERAANDIEKRAATSDSELRQVFVNAHNALASYYYDEATQSLAKKEISSAGKFLMAAAAHLEQAWYWSGRRLEDAAQKVVNSAKDLGSQVGDGVLWAAEEVDKRIKDLGRQIGKSVGRELDNRKINHGPADIGTGIIKVARMAIPAVAHIQVTERQEIPNPFLPYEKNPFLRRFFGLPKKMPKKFERELVGVGTGIIIDAEGHILTNNHVVGGAKKIQVTLSNGIEYPAEVIGTDPKTDLGVIKIAAERPLPYLSFGNSDEIQVGQWVVAIGHPRGLDQTVTQGIISAKHRRGVIDPTSYSDFLQTDTPINPGNSGGPLLDLDGEVIGVNSAILSESGGFEGIGFAIPSNMAFHIAQALIAHGKVLRGWLGIGVQDMTPALAKSFDLDFPKGALVSEVMKNGPADKAGVKNGDIILSFDGKAVTDATMLRNNVANSPIGEKVHITVWRKGKKERIRAKVGSLEEAMKKLADALKARLGILVEALTEQDAQNYGINLSRGVKISWIDSNGVLGQFGFEKGDIILAINGQPVEDVQAFIERILAMPHHQKIRLLALDHRSGQRGYVQVKIN